MISTSSSAPGSASVSDFGGLRALMTQTVNTIQTLYYRLYKVRRTYSTIVSPTTADTAEVLMTIISNIHDEGL